MLVDWCSCPRVLVATMVTLWILTAETALRDIATSPSGKFGFRLIFLAPLLALRAIWTIPSKRCDVRLRKWRIWCGSVSLSVGLSVCLSVCQSVGLSVRLSVCLSFFGVIPSSDLDETWSECFLTVFRSFLDSLEPSKTTRNHTLPYFTVSTSAVFFY